MKPQYIRASHQVAYKLLIIETGERRGQEGIVSRRDVEGAELLSNIGDQGTHVRRLGRVRELLVDINPSEQ